MGTAVLACASGALARKPPPPAPPLYKSIEEPPPCPDLEEADDESGLSFETGFTWVGEHGWRGCVSEDSGFIGQPHAELGIPLVVPDDEDGVWVDAYIGTWNSSHSEKTDSTGDDPGSRYESDLCAGSSLAF